MSLTRSTLPNDSHLVLKDKPQGAYLHLCPGHEVSKVTYSCLQGEHTNTCDVTSGGQLSLATLSTALIRKGTGKQGYFYPNEISDLYDNP